MVNSDDTTFLYIALQYIPGLGARRASRLLTKSDSIQNIVHADARTLRNLRLSDETNSALQDLARSGNDSVAGKQALTAIEKLDAEGWAALSLEDPRYPVLLRETPIPPALLYVNGDVELLVSKQIAMVGSRHASHSGVDIARQFAAQLGHAGLTITSGLALGIDAASHRGALDAGCPTIAVMGTGLDCIYPRRHQALAAEIAQHGAIVTEFPLGTAPHAKNFPQRNRIISGMARGVLVVEAALRSGSLITARHALEQNREVFAIPGSIHSPVSKGCNALIQQGAKLTETTTDVLSELQGCEAKPVANNAAAGKTASGLDGEPAAQQILAAVGFEPTDIDKIIRRSDLPAADVLAALMLLELEGYIAGGSGGFSRIR